TDHGDEELGRAVSEGRRREFSAFGWDPADVPDPQDEQTFLRSKLDWDEAGRSHHAELLAWHRDLIRLRHDVPALAGGVEGVSGVDVRWDGDARWLVVERGPVSVVCNLGEAEQAVPLDSAAADLLTDDGRAVVVPPETVVVLG
ncbi:MAG: DUF3459 domain-containing protein, partial [Acidimicrobiia bacterium]|nr:DUF3459 domain-containing protein [Acidimicrobiia bacterium]